MDFRKLHRFVGHHGGSSVASSVGWCPSSRRSSSSRPRPCAHTAGPCAADLQSHSLLVLLDRITNIDIFPVLTPATFFLLVWLCRRGLAQSRRPARSRCDARLSQRMVEWLAILLVAWVLPLMAASHISRVGISWTATYLVAVVAPIVLHDTHRESAVLRVLCHGWSLGLRATHSSSRSSK
jgi:hypothetical protein